MISERLKDWKGWLSEGQFYIYGMVYMLVRIAVNVTMVRPLSHKTSLVSTTILFVKCHWIRKDS